MKAFAAIVIGLVLAGCGSRDIILVKDGATIPEKPNAKCDGIWEVSGGEWTCRTMATGPSGPAVYTNNPGVARSLGYVPVAPPTVQWGIHLPFPLWSPQTQSTTIVINRGGGSGGYQRPAPAPADEKNPLRRFP